MVIPSLAKFFYSKFQLIITKQHANFIFGIGIAKDRSEYRFIAEI